jgi:hypothetical protein
LYRTSFRFAGLFKADNGGGMFLRNVGDLSELHDITITMPYLPNHVCENLEQTMASNGRMRNEMKGI